jgi:DNA-binding Lrp family transcriptional regulator
MLVKIAELKLISELMKNSRRSDRELARKIRVSQPTVTRLRNKLEREGYIREYTMIPDFTKLGFEVIAMTFIKSNKRVTTKEYDRIVKAAVKLNQEKGLSVIMSVRGMGLGYDIVIISVHENYSTYREMIKEIRQPHQSDVFSTESFIANLTDDTRYHPLTFSALAEYLPRALKRETITRDKKAHSQSKPRN